MRKLKLQVQMSIDGFIAGPNGEMDWLNHSWSEDLKDYVEIITDPVDTILLGRNLAEGFIPHWTASYNSPQPEEGAEKFVKTPKVVFTKSLNESDPAVIGWDNTVLAKGDLFEEVNTIRREVGGDIIVYGGGRFVSSLIRENLIDELHLFINPSILGKGMPIFSSITQAQNYTIQSARQFDCGIVVLTYKSN